MQKIILSIVLTVTTLFSSDINIYIPEIKNMQGDLFIGLYKNPENFTILEKTYKGAYLKISAKDLSHSFHNIPNGKYAICLFHDENTNAKLDTNFFGKPTEGYGFSNNIRPTFRAASFEESQFVVNGNVDLNITMGY